MSRSRSITYYRLTDHALFEMARRGIDEAEVALVLATPEQVEAVRANRSVYQRRVEVGEPPRQYLLRVVVDVDRSPAEVVTVYRTSKVDKYWPSKP